MPHQSLWKSLTVSDDVANGAGTVLARFAHSLFCEPFPFLFTVF